MKHIILSSTCLLPAVSIRCQPAAKAAPSVEFGRRSGILFVVDIFFRQRDRVQPSLADRADLGRLDRLVHRYGVFQEVGHLALPFVVLIPVALDVLRGPTLCVVAVKKELVVQVHRLGLLAGFCSRRRRCRCRCCAR